VQYGHQGGSLRNIAEEVGVTSATLVNHFGHKEALLTAVLKHWSDESKSLNPGSSGLAFFEGLPQLMDTTQAIEDS
jgi:AcrR family transcriptional regulator